MPDRAALRGPRRTGAAVLIAAALVLAAAPLARAYQPPGVTTRVSLGQGGQQASDHLWNPALSADGRVVAFDTRAPEMLPSGTGGSTQVYVRNLATDALELVSRTPQNLPARGDSTGPALSADGRFVAFTSRAADLVPGDTNERIDGFVLDRAAGTVERVSLAEGGAQLAADSGVYDISDDGRYVAFYSFASDVVPGDTNNLPDIFVRDRVDGRVQLVSVATDGTQVNALASQATISGNGRYVAFDSSASTLVPGDRNRTADVFVRDLVRGTTERVSVASDGTEGNSSSQFASISADGRFVAFRSFSSNLVENQEVATGHVFVHDRATRTTERVSVTSAGAEADSVSNNISISADGRFVAFYSFGSRVVAGPSAAGPDVFVHDRFTRSTELVSASSEGTTGNSWSTSPAISADGRLVAFRSTASNLVPDDTNDVWDVFVRDRGAAEPVVAVTADGDTTHVEGWARLPGTTVAAETDPRGDVAPGAEKLGLDIVAAEVLYRPEVEDLLVRIVPTELPSVRGPLAAPLVGALPTTGGPGSAYSVRFRVGAATYAATATRLNPTAAEPSRSRFELRRCGTSCGEAVAIAGGIGTARADVTLSIPLALLEAHGPLGEVTVSSHTASADPAARIDELRLADVPALQHGVRVGVGITRQEAEWRHADLANGRFTAVHRALRGGERVWVETCVACDRS